MWSVTPPVVYDPPPISRTFKSSSYMLTKFGKHSAIQTSITMLGIGMTKSFKLLMCTYGAVICKLWSAIENLAVWSKNQKCGIFTLNLTVIRTILAVKQRENGKNNDYTHITDPGVLLNSGHDFIRLLSFARLRWESVTMSLISSTSWSALSPIFSLVENAR